MEPENQDQHMLRAPDGAEDVILDSRDGKWFVAVRLDEPHPDFTHERFGDGFDERVDALHAAYDLAVGQDLSIGIDPAMTEEVKERFGDAEHWDEH